MKLSQDHEDFRKAVREMAQTHVAPVADEIDKTDKFPEHLIEVFGDMGLVQLAVPEEFGGPGGDLLSGCIAREEVAAAGSMALAQLAGQNSIVINAMLDGASDTLKKEILPKLAEGRTITCIAITEPDAGSDPSLMQARAKKVGDTWVLNGSKQFITWGSMAKYSLVFARTNDLPVPAASARSSSTVTSPVGRSPRPTTRWASTVCPTTRSFSTMSRCTRSSSSVKRATGSVPPCTACT